MASRTGILLASITLLALGSVLLPSCQPPASAPAGGWTVIEKVSPIDDSPGVLMTIRAEDDVELGGIPVRPRLAVECVEGASVLTVEAPGTHMCTETMTVTLRFDKDEARSEEWLCTDDHSGVGLSSLDELAVLSEMEAHERMLVRFRPPGLGTVLAAFDISKFREHLPKIKKACDWE